MFFPATIPSTEPDGLRPLLAVDILIAALPQPWKISPR